MTLFTFRLLTLSFLSFAEYAVFSSFKWAEMYITPSTVAQRFDFAFKDAEAAGFEVDSDQFIHGTKARARLRCHVTTYKALHVIIIRNRVVRLTHQYHICKGQPSSRIDASRSCIILEVLADQGVARRNYSSASWSLSQKHMDRQYKGVNFIIILK